MTGYTISAYVICPVRGQGGNELLSGFIERIEKEGIKCHYPPRDVDQSSEGIDIVNAHLQAMMTSDLVMVWWDESSYGSHVDLGMALVASARGAKLVRLNEYNCKMHSYGAVLKQISTPAIINFKDDYDKALKIAAIAGIDRKETK